MGLRGLNGRRHDRRTVEGAGQGDEARAPDTGEALDQGASRDDAGGEAVSVAADIAEGRVPRDTALEGHGFEPIGLI
ncbi:hypothetical protein MKK69_21715 [Methylobacterium sp. J-026]|uniref:hypothetical protein n=1 Tax=Methylobacterium sp. J-026 TaxID=2836624 RepID=UPI001FBA9A14|nr:hypothetical protein [Methylobacterium sp. J-026]MCJ2136631.1 hypothetical protein [Methylobacterium sp. J-026]